MKTLLLARHGTAEQRHEGRNDFDRNLVSAGEKEAAFAGKRLRKTSVSPEIIISSPAPRAWSTAKVICDKINFPKEKIRTEKILYTGNVLQVLEVLRKTKGDEKAVMLCGHNPLLEEIFASLCGGQVKEIRKGEIVCISLTIDGWKNIKTGSGKYSFMIKQNKNSNQTDMKNDKAKNKKKELQAQVSDLINAFAKSKTNTDSKKIRKSVKEASKLVAKAILKTLSVEAKAKKKTVKKKITKKVKGIKAKPAAGKIKAKKPAPAKVISRNVLSSMTNVAGKVPTLESNPEQV